MIEQHTSLRGALVVLVAMLGALLPIACGGDAETPGVSPAAAAPATAPEPAPPQSPEPAAAAVQPASAATASEEDSGITLGSLPSSLVGEAEEDEAGQALAGVGDVNGDGLSDLLIGAWANDEGGTDAGKAFLVLGRREPLGRGVSLSQADAAFVGCEELGYAGFAVSGAGDVNGDGLDDMLIGANGLQSSEENSGGAYLVLGRREADWGAHFSLASAEVTFRGCSQAFCGQSFGGGGDLNGDGLADFAIGAPRLDNGHTYVIFGRREGWPAILGPESADLDLVAPPPQMGTGVALAANGDVDGDGIDDLLAGASSSGRQETGLEGRVMLALGRSSSSEVSVSLISPEAEWTGEYNRDSLGQRVAFVGDVNGDGLDDLLMAAPRNHGLEQGSEYWAGCGQTYLWFGRRGAWPTGPSLASADASFIGEAGEDGSGSSVAGCGDVNGDGLGDILIGSPGHDGAARDAGKVHLILGRREGWASRTSLGEADAAYVGVNRRDQAGSSVDGIGDFNGDGVDDFAIGARYSDTAAENAGEVHLVLSPHAL